MLKNTKTRTLVREILDKSNSPLTPAEIFEKLKTLDVTLSSIYRTLDAFTKEDVVIKANDQKGTALYTLNKDDHYHYLECKNCHQKIQLNYCPYHKVNHELSKKYNFDIDESNVVIYGVCNNCKTKCPSEHAICNHEHNNNN